MYYRDAIYQLSIANNNNNLTRLEDAIDFSEHLQRFGKVVDRDNTCYEVESVGFEWERRIFVQVSHDELVDLLVLRELVLVHSHSDRFFELNILDSIRIRILKGQYSRRWLSPAGSGKPRNCKCPIL